MDVSSKGPPSTALLISLNEMLLQNFSKPFRQITRYNLKMVEDRCRVFIKVE